MIAPKVLEKAVIDSGIKRSESEFIKPVIIDGNLVACFSDDSLVPGFISASMKTGVDGLTTMTVTFETQVKQ